MANFWAFCEHCVNGFPSQISTHPQKPLPISKPKPWAASMKIANAPTADYFNLLIFPFSSRLLRLKKIGLSHFGGYPVIILQICHHSSDILNEIRWSNINIMFGIRKCYKNLTPATGFILRLEKRFPLLSFLESSTRSRSLINLVHKVRLIQKYEFSQTKKSRWLKFLFLFILIYIN